MPLFSVQILYCSVCGKAMSVHVGNALFSKAVCSWRCLNQKDWREVLSMMGQEYYPDPKDPDYPAPPLPEKEASFHDY